MRRATVFLFALIAASFMATAAFAAPAFHIGVATLTVSQAEDTYRGAERLIKEYGDVANGGMIKHVTMPDNFMSEMETTISQIVGLADDPKMKVIVVNQAIPGTAEAFRRVKEKRDFSFRRDSSDFFKVVYYARHVRHRVQRDESGIFFYRFGDVARVYF